MRPEERVFMFIKTIKVKKPMAALVATVVLILCIVVVIAMIIGKIGKPTVYTLKTETQRQDFMKSMGWSVSEKYLECKVITIPDEFNDVYTGYNDLQKEQGFDLEKYKGKTVEIYSYQVYNYKDHEDKDCMICNLMIYDGVLIGGDVCCTELEGFIQGLRNNDSSAIDVSSSNASSSLTDSVESNEAANALPTDADKAGGNSEVTDVTTANADDAADEVNQDTGVSSEVLVDGD